MTERQRERDKTDSERFFEQYLKENDLRGFQHHPVITGKSETPDYRLVFQGKWIFFEVKQFEPTEKNFRPGFGQFDPHSPIRWKIHGAWPQFQGLEQSPCCLVLYNSRKPLVFLSPEVIYGAMLGNISFEILFDTRRGIAVGEPRPVFGTSGMVLRYEAGRAVEPRNRTLSAIAVLEHFKVGERRFLSTAPQSDHQLSSEERFGQTLAAARRARGSKRDVSLRELRVVVHENPFATKKLPRDIFRKSYDEWYGPSRRGRLERIFVGREARHLEALAKGLKSPVASLFRKTRRARGKP